jgi:hypothetical protein
VFPLEYVVVARHAQDDRGATSTRRTSSDRPRVPVPPEHLYRPGRGTTLCGEAVDETWERFSTRRGLLSVEACIQCRQIMDTAP